MAQAIFEFKSQLEQQLYPLVRRMLHYDPRRRYSASDALSHPFIADFSEHEHQRFLRARSQYVQRLIAEQASAPVDAPPQSAATSADAAAAFVATDASLTTDVARATDAAPPADATAAPPTTDAATATAVTDAAAARHPGALFALLAT